MKRILSAMFVTVCLAMVFNTVSAQTSTYILVRHAEKDTMRSDPPLTLAGQKRAQKLVDALKSYTPDAIYSTNYSRTKSTVAPLCLKFSKEVEIYNPTKLDAFAAQLLEQKGKTIIVAGHSNTTPALANLLLKEKTYTDLDDSVYNQFWVVTVTADGKASAKVVTY